MTLSSHPWKEMFGKELDSVHVQSEVCDIWAVLFAVTIRIYAPKCKGQPRHFVRRVKQGLSVLLTERLCRG